MAGMAMGKRLKKLFSRLLHLSSSTSSFFFKHVIMNICKETCSHLETANIARKLVLMLAKIIFGFYVNNTRSEKNLHCRTSTLANTKSVTVIIQPLIILCTRQLHIPWSLVLLQLLALSNQLWFDPAMMPFNLSQNSPWWCCSLAL